MPILVNQGKQTEACTHTVCLVYLMQNQVNYPSALAALPITGAIRDSSREKLYQELGLETLQQRLQYRKLCCFYKIRILQSPKYLYSIILMYNISYRARQFNKIPTINVKHDFFKNTFFPSTIIEWNKLDWKIKNSESIETLKKNEFCNSLIHLLIAHSITITLEG